MRRALSALVGAIVLTACGQHAANPYPDSAKAQFDAACPADDPVCVCTWDHITRELTDEEYEAALAHFRETGSMDHRVTHARTYCVEHHQS